MGFEDVYESPGCAEHSLNLLSLHQSQHHEDEKRALSREIIVLNNHLMEAKLTIEKLQEDNVGPVYHSECCCQSTLSSVQATVSGCLI